MAHNSIIRRVADELGACPPFDRMEREDLELLAVGSEIIYAAAGEIIFREDQPPHPHVFFIHEGRIDLYRENILADTSENGDLVGVRSMLTGNNYVLEARVSSPSVLYRLPLSILERIVGSNPDVALFFARGLAAGQTYAPDFQALFQVADHAEHRPASSLGSSLISCKRNIPIKDAAAIMTEKSIGSLIITNLKGYPEGIITDTDLRRKVATGSVSVDEPVQKIMSAPVITASVDATIQELLVIMLEKNIHHICLTEDSTTNSPGTHMVSERDLIMVQENHPALLNKRIRHANETGTLKTVCDQSLQLLTRYIEQQVPSRVCMRIFASIHDTVLRQCISLSRFKINDFAWIALGSQGRSEQMLLTDMDSSIIFSTGTDKSDILTFADDVITKLTECGFSRCPANVMASNPEWCLDLDDWISKIRGWINSPDSEALMHASTFFDMRVLHGNHQLLQKLRNNIAGDLKKQSSFINFLAMHAVKNPPPVGFFKQFILEQQGQHEHEFDLKARILMPLTDGARVLCLSYGQLEITNTAERFKWLAIKEPVNAILYEEAADAFGWLSILRAQHGIQRNDSGRYVNIEQLNKREKRLLRNTFGPVRKLQELLTVRFQLDYIRN